MTATATRPVSIAVLPAVPVASLRRFAQEPAGDWTLRDVVEATGLPDEAVTVSLDGEIVPIAQWDRSPEPGASVIVTQRPGVTGAWVLAGAILNAGMASGAAIVVAAQVVLTAIIVATGTYALSALANALFSTSENSAEAVKAGARRTIAGGGNGFQPYATIPQVLGKHRLYPPLAAQSYTTVEDGKLYQYALFTFGYGKLALSEVKIRDEPLFRE